MNRKIVFKITGRLLEALSLILLLPMLVSIIYKEDCFLSFLITAGISLILGVALRLFTRNCKKDLYAKEGFLIVSLAWVSASLVGCLPFILSGEITSFADAFFETVSGFTTTGATVVTDISCLSHGILFWRSFTHWIGGMGVLVFMVAFLSNISDKAIHILRAEMSGPVVGKMVPRAKDTSKVLYTMYIALTVVQIALLCAGEMNLFEAAVHSFGTVGTGGFGIYGDSVGSYSAYSQWIIIIFMLISGVNFNLYYLLTVKRFKSVFKSEELWTYFGIFAVATLLIITNIHGMFSSVEETVRQAAFQVSSIITTTGFATSNFDLWPDFSKAIIFILLFTGACAGSTAGGLKLSRVVIMFKMIKKEIKRMIHPRSVATVKFEGKEVDDSVQKGITTYFFIYMLGILTTFVVLSLEPFGFITNFTAAVTAFNNVGPGFGLVGPAGSFAAYSDFSKIFLSFAMLFGRLEIFPLLIALIPSTWKKK